MDTRLCNRSLNQGTSSGVSYLSTTMLMLDPTYLMYIHTQACTDAAITTYIPRKLGISSLLHQTVLFQLLTYVR